MNFSLNDLIRVLKGGPGSGPRPGLFPGPRNESTASAVNDDSSDMQVPIEPLTSAEAMELDESLYPMLTADQRDRYGDDPPNKLELEAELERLEVRAERSRQRSERHRSQRAKLQATQEKRRQRLRKIQEERQQDVHSVDELLSG